MIEMGFEDCADYLRQRRLGRFEKLESMGSKVQTSLIYLFVPHSLLRLGENLQRISPVYPVIDKNLLIDSMLRLGKITSEPCAFGPGGFLVTAVTWRSAISYGEVLTFENRYNIGLEERR